MKLRTMRTYIILVIAVSFGVFSCKTGQNAVKDEVVEEKSIENYADSTDAESISPEINADDTLFASLSRTSCFGTCPIYTIDIYKSGYVVYNGKRFVQKTGIYSTRISEEKMRQFKDTAEAIGYVQMEDVYDGPISDIPSAITSIVIDGKRKSVRRRYGYPKSIIRFEELFDELLASEEWILIEATNDH